MRLLQTGVLLGACLLCPGLLPAGQAPPPKSGTQASAGAELPAQQYAHMSESQCYRELKRRKVSFRPVEQARGVRYPVRVRGKIGSVTYRTNYRSPEERRTTPYEVYDCRLVLALYDLSKILWTHDIEEVRIFSAWRPPSKHWPEDKHGVRHPGALAADLQRFIKKTGESLSVAEHFNGEVGAALCGPEAAAPEPPTAQAQELRNIACEAAEQRIFQSILTPNYDRPHFDHFHVEVRPEVKWWIFR